MNKFGKKLLAVTLSLAMLIPSGSQFNAIFAADTTGTDTKTVQILQTSDLHGKFVPFKYATYSEDTSGSLAQVATVIKERKDNNTILIDVGDTIQDNSAQLFLEDEIHPMIEGLNILGYDFWELGNHEFNFGVEPLKKIIKQFKGTTLCANVYDKDGTTRLGAAYKIVEKENGIRVAVIGVDTTHITRWDQANLEGYTVTDTVKEINAAVAEIKKEEKPVSAIIVAAHVSMENEYDTANTGAEDIAKACPGIDVILAAHGHAKGTKKFGDVLVTENAASGQSLTDIDLTFKKNDKGDYVLDKESTKVEQVAVKGVKADEAFLADEVIKAADAKAKEDALTIIGTLAGGDLSPADEVKGITQSQVQETAMINLINKVQMKYTGADIAAAAVFDASSNILAGPIAKKDASLIYKYDNTLYKLKMTGKQLKQFMEWSASYYNTYKKGDLTVSFNENIRIYSYDMFSGVNYEINISKEPGSRIENLTYKGKAIKDDDTFVVAVNNYRANSQLLSYGTVYSKEKGDTLPELIEKDVENGAAVRDLIAKYIEEQGGTIYPEYNNNWKITGTDWDETLRDRVVALTQAGKITVPTSADGRTPNVKSITESDIAAFDSVKVTRIKFDANGGVSNGNSIIYVDGEKLEGTDKAVVFRSGYKFLGWYTKAKGGKAVTDKKINSYKTSRTLYAHWTKVKFKTVKVKSTKVGKTILKLKFTNVKCADKYIVTYSTDKKFKKNVKTVEVKSPKATLKKLKAGKTYYVKVQVVSTDSLGIESTSKLSKRFKFKTTK